VPMAGEDRGRDETVSAGSNGGDPAELAAGSELAGHRIEAEIGRGGMGVVYRARNIALDRERALKVIAPGLAADAEFRERFQREARLAASIEHPNVVPVHQAGEETGRFYIAMRLVPGTDLRTLIAREGPLEPAQAVTIAGEVAAALDAAHAAGIVHRDVKPANVMVEAAADGERAYLTDFGISRLAEATASLTSSDRPLGTADYMAPEQIEGGELSPATDVYALGCVLHFALTGEPPYPRDNELAKLYAHTSADPPRPSAVRPELPEAIDAVVARSLAKRPAERYGSAGALAAAAAEALGVSAPVATPVRFPTPAEPDTGPTARIARPARRRRIVAAIAALVAVAAAAVIGIVALGGDGGGTSQPTTSSPSHHRPSAGRPVATIKVGAGPTGIIVGGIAIWVASRDAHALYSVDPSTNKQALTPVGVNGTPVAVAVDFGSIWAANDQTDTLARVDPRESNARVNIPVGRFPSDVTVGDGAIWVANQGSATISRIDPATNLVTATIRLADQPGAIAFGDGFLWTVSPQGQSVAKVSPGKQSMVDSVQVPGEPSDVAVGEGNVWVTDSSGDQLVGIDPDEMRPAGKPIDVGANPSAVKTGFGSVWVANAGDSTVSRVDPKRGKAIGRPIRVGKGPEDVAVGKESVWTANSRGATVTRIKP
jgi:YVTN family beta-propeller protein